ncbi:Peptidase family M23 [Anaerocolumna xylanovorans DSM 12503]|uniref:Peptidase family M23 n=1 Tax=Anaerocolumna xylanovorans DSM 12503 TaxID=1121345 RepID=A0A1M7YB03_9FIRM|nr:Peptidase family M23 [Anaerocolumna xylanovorans DSM 12503]
MVFFIFTLVRLSIWLDSCDFTKVSQTIIREGIDYDYFREMLLPEEVYRDINVCYQSGEEKESECRAEYAAIYTLLKQNNLLKGDNISARKLDYLKESLKDNKSCQELMGYYETIISDLKLFPVDATSEEDEVSYGDTWSELRNYGGNRRHEGTDIFPKENIPGKYKVISATDGVVERLGWLEKGGYRVGIRAPHGAYIYYAHLDSYAKGLKIGDIIKAGDLLGYMGDSGYGKEGTKGMFPVHLHFGIYVDTTLGETSVNPYRSLLYLEGKDS